jgi:hypothetical protein
MKLIQNPDSFLRMFPGFLLFSLICIGFSACKQPDLGLELQNPADNVTLLRYDSLNIRSTMEVDDSVKTDELSLNLLGSYNDPLLGLMRAGFYAQLRPSVSNINLGVNPKIDSVILVLPYRSAYGDLTKLNGLQKFSVYQLEGSMDLASSYYSTDTIQRKYLIGERELVPQLTDSVTVSGRKEIPQMRIKLLEGPNGVGEQLINNPSALLSADAFVQFFKGIYVESSLSDNIPGNGAILDFSLQNGARMDVYYQNDANDSLRTTFVVNENSARFTRFNHTYLPEILAMLDNGANTQASFFVQNMSGFRGRIEFPTLLAWKGDRNILLNKAQLIIPVDPEFIGKYPPNILLNMVSKNSVGTLIKTPDLAVGSTYSLGEYVAGKHMYRFNITLYLQKLLKGNSVDYGLFIQPTGTGVSANRVRLNGFQHPVNPMKIELLYEELQN